MLSILKNILNTGSNQQAVASTLQAASKPIVKAPSTQGNHKDAEEAIPQQSRLRKAKLIMVTAANNNKFYQLEEQEDDTFIATYGRVGTRGTTRKYPIHLWDKKIREKLNKGYKDTTYLFAESSGQEDFLDIDDASVRNLVDELMHFAKQSVRTNYFVTSNEVTLQQVRAAQGILDQLVPMLSRRMKVEAFNKLLVELYTIIPRRMSSVRDHLLEKPKKKSDLEALENKLAEEQATLDVMRGQVEVNDQQSDIKAQAQTLLEAMGLQIELVDDKALIKNIKKMMGPKASHFHRAFKVVNIKTQLKFDRFIQTSKHKKTQLFWHGSRNENWLSIMKAGLVLRPANAIINGKMFGYGLYFADKCAKSLNYSSLRGSYWSGGNQSKGFLALYDVHVGHQLKIKKHETWCPQLTADNLKKQGKDYDSVFAKGGVDLINNEYIVYHQDQCTIRYFIEVN